MQTIVEIKVKPEDIDGLGHVNNLRYLDYLEELRVPWYGAPRHIEGMPVRTSTVVVNLNVNFRKEARLGETMTVVTKTVSIGNTSYTTRQEIYNEKKELLVEVDAILVLFDLDVRQKVPFNDEFIAYITSGKEPLAMENVKK